MDIGSVTIATKQSTMDRMMQNFVTNEIFG